MDDETTRQIALRVRRILEEQGAVDLDRVVALLRVPGTLAFEAFGWMSREHSIVIEGNRVRLRCERDSAAG